MGSKSASIERGNQTLKLQGEELVLLLEGALWCDRLNLLVLSDLHFEKGSSFALAGQLLPPYDTDATLDLIEQLIAQTGAETCISLGDSFHDQHADRRLSASSVSRIRKLTAQTDWVWVEGNHDPLPPVALGGRATHLLRIGALVFRHEPTGEEGEVAGHLHPVARVKASGRHLRRKCFVTDGRSLILPSLGAYTGGLNICHSAFDACLKGARRVFALGGERIYEISEDRLIPDRQ